MVAASGRQRMRGAAQRVVWRPGSGAQPWHRVGFARDIGKRVRAFRGHVLCRIIAALHPGRELTAVVKPLPRLKLRASTTSPSRCRSTSTTSATRRPRTSAGATSSTSTRNNADRLTQILTDVAEIIGANILNIARQDYDPQGASVTILISEQPVIDKADAKGVISDAVVAHSTSRTSPCTLPETHPDNGIATPSAPTSTSHLRRDLAAEGVELPDRDRWKATSW